MSEKSSKNELLEVMQEFKKNVTVIMRKKLNKSQQKKEIVQLAEDLKMKLTTMIEETDNTDRKEALEKTISEIDLVLKMVR